MIPCVLRNKPDMRPSLNRRLAAPVLFLCACVFAADAFPSNASRFIEYLYINASEGTASGGHAAIQFGDEVFHFQHVPPGLLRAIREESGWFRHQYGDLENRTIHSHRIAVSEETYALLHDHFSRRLLIQDEQFERRAAILKDRGLIESLLSRQPHRRSLRPQTLDVNGAGLFVPDGWDVARPSQTDLRYPADASLTNLRKRTEERYGPEFLRIKSSEIRTQLHGLHPSPLDPQNILLSEDLFQPAVYSFADRYADLLTALIALQVLERAMPLRSELLLQPDSAEFRLKPGELAKLADFRDQLAAEMVNLMESDRPDWGFPLLIGMARLIALDASISSGKLVVVDFLTHSEAAMDGPFDISLRRGLFDGPRHLFQGARQVLRAEDALDERGYSRIEQAASLLWESRAVLQQGRPLRVFAGSGRSLRSARVQPIWPLMTAMQVTAYSDELKAYGEAFEAALAELYGYDLISRNCVSEIFRSIDTAMARQLGKQDDTLDRAQRESWVKRDSIRRLGGHVERNSLNSIPFVSFKAVGESWRVSSTEVLPSLRHQRLEEAYSKDDPLLVGLRESNVLSANLYHWHEHDAAFLFFTDEMLWSRPLAGGVNLAIGLGQGVAGLLTWPWDAGQNLRQGVKGFLISLPELFFFNIRKGSYPALPGPRSEPVNP